MGDTFVIGQAQDTFTVGIGADGFTVAPEINLFEVGADVTTITVNYGAVTVGGTSDVTLPIEISDVTGLQAALDAADATGFLRVAYLFDLPVDASGTITPPVPAGLPVLLNAQADGAEDGLYESDGSGGITGTPVPIKTLANYLARLVVFAQGATTDVLTEPPGTFYDSNTRPADENFIDVRMVTTADGVTFALTPQGIPASAWMDQSGKSYTPAMNDFGGVNTDLQLTVNHQIVSCNPSTPITLTMPPHLTKPRHCYITIEPTATANVTVVEYPGEAEFSHVLLPGERALILPDQALWEVWHFPKVGQEIGDVVGPASSIDGRPALFDGTDGKLLKVGSAPFAPGGTATASSSGTTANTVRAVTLDSTGGTFDLTLANGNPWHVNVRHAAGSASVDVYSEAPTLIATVAAGETWTFVAEGAGTTWTAHKESPISGGSGDVATDAIFDAKGDLAVGTGADTAAKLTVGAGALMADPSASTGLVYGVVPHLGLTRPYVAGKYYAIPRSTTGTAGFAADFIRYLPYIPHARVTMDRLIIYTTATSGGAARMGIYDSDGTNSYPGTLILDAGTVATTAASGERAITISQSLQPGHLYWLAVVFNVSTTCAHTLRSSYTEPQWGEEGALSGPLWTANESYAYAALPATATPTAVNASMPTIWLRAS